MKITFLSNYINHHQLPFSNVMYEKLKEDYCFIQTEPMEEERVSMGWANELSNIPYLHCFYQEEALCREKILSCDVLLAGWTEREELIEERLNLGKLTFRISERIYREGQWKMISPRGLFHKYKEHIRYRRKPAYLLCAGAYVASDFRLLHAYPGKMFKFGYFPEFREHTVEELFAKKSKERTDIIFAARFIPLKHPEYMIQLAADLKQRSLPFHIHMVGSGQMEQELRQRAKELQVEELVTFYGFMKPEEVRDHMEQCHIQIFPSNHLEGWGAVINEGMNSGCAVIASAEAGAVPYLIKQGITGYAYPDNDYEKMKNYVIQLMEAPQSCEKIGENSYRYIRDYWNASHAAEELLRMLNELQRGEGPVPAAEGPLSTAQIITPGRKGFSKWTTTNQS